MSPDFWWLALAVIVLLVVGVVLLRRYQLHRLQTRGNHEPFDGTVYRVGEAFVAVRAGADPPRCSVIAMHGFLEDHRYFTALYRDPSVDLILITSGDYNVPVRDVQPRAAPWMRPIEYELGTIEYDAAVLNQALENLPRSAHVRLHGHSRGGAVVLEAAMQRPDLHQRSEREIEVVLEAPCLPGGRAHANMEARLSVLGRFLLPFAMPLIKRLPPEVYGRALYGPLSGRKRELLRGYPRNPRHYATVLVNAASIREWMAGQDASVYQGVGRGWILVGQDERILDRDSMLASAHQAGHALEVVETVQTTHFISLDQPDQVPPLFPG